MRIPLIGGSYKAQSLIANAQRCINLYGEKNVPGAPCPMTYYPTPGLTLAIVGPMVGAWRCLYTATNGTLFGVLGKTVYAISPSLTLTSLGTLTSFNTPVSMADNGLVVLIVDGSPNGYCIDLTNNNAFGQVSDSNFLGADSVQFVDTFFILNVPGTNQWYISLSNVDFMMLTSGTPGAAFDPLDIATKDGYPDPIASLIVVHREIWLIGTQTTEIWFNSGAADFTFQIIPGVFLQHGCIAKYSICAQDLSVYWLGNDKQGERIVFKGSGYAARRISTHAIEAEFATYSTVSDAIGYTYQQNGHTFYVLVFPTAGKTWAFDEATQEWHERMCLDPQGNFMRHWGNCAASAYDRIFVGDFQNGNLYYFDLNNFKDNGTPITRVRGFPHLTGDRGERIYYDQFIADMEVGTDDGMIDGSTQTNPPLVSLRWSDDRGKTFGNRIEQSLGALGLYRTSMLWRRLGMARDRVFELEWSCPTKTALNGAFIDSRPGGS